MFKVYEIKQIWSNYKNKTNIKFHLETKLWSTLRIWNNKFTYLTKLKKGDNLHNKYMIIFRTFASFICYGKLFFQR